VAAGVFRQSFRRKARPTAVERGAFWAYFVDLPMDTNLLCVATHLGDEADNHLMELAVACQADGMIAVLLQTRTSA